MKGPFSRWSPQACNVSSLSLWVHQLMPRSTEPGPEMGSHWVLIQPHSHPRHMEKQGHRGVSKRVQGVGFFPISRGGTQLCGGLCGLRDTASDLCSPEASVWSCSPVPFLTGSPGTGMRVGRTLKTHLPVPPCHLPWVSHHGNAVPPSLVKAPCANRAFIQPVETSPMHPTPITFSGLASVTPALIGLFPL